MGADGKATLEHAFTSAGSHAVSAYYSGATGFMPSMASAQTSPCLIPHRPMSPPRPHGSSRDDQAECRGRTVRDGHPQPRRGARFSSTTATNPSDKPVVVGVDGVARLTHTFASTGDHRIKGSYAGRSGFTQSASDESVVKVSAAPDDGGEQRLGQPRLAEWSRSDPDRNSLDTVAAAPIRSSGNSMSRPQSQNRLIYRWSTSV